MRLPAEVIGRFDHAGDANSLLYTPLSEKLTARHTRRYLVDYTGDEKALTAFLAKVLADPVSHELRTGEAPALDGYSFYLDYGMKAGALDHEKETILALHRSTAAAASATAAGNDAGSAPNESGPAFTITGLKINHRVYLYGPEGTAAHADRFVRDIVNPAIHTWQVTAA
ncbi:MAG: hypothetical protein JWL81_2863 [Verrucomicrobiales bacterium]|nr:hypothetical protein [Verrucomicrobiales bacterium]